MRSLDGQTPISIMDWIFDSTNVSDTLWVERRVCSAGFVNVDSYGLERRFQTSDCYKRSTGSGVVGTQVFQVADESAAQSTCVFDGLWFQGDDAIGRHDEVIGFEKADLAGGDATNSGNENRRPLHRSKGPETTSSVQRDRAVADVGVMNENGFLGFVLDAVHGATASYHADAKSRFGYERGWTGRCRGHFVDRWRKRTITVLAVELGNVSFAYVSITVTAYLDFK